MTCVSYIKKTVSPNLKQSNASPNTNTANDDAYRASAQRILLNSGFYKTYTYFTHKARCRVGVQQKNISLKAAE